MEVESTDGEDLWQPPPRPSRKLFQIQKSTAHDFYAKAYGTMQKWWGVPASEAVPVECRKTTYWSLALFIQLKKLAELTKKDMPLGHAILKMYWRRRQEARDPQGPDHVTSETKHIYNGPEKNFIEPKITENTSGMMLCDIQEACRHVRETRSTLMQDNPDARNEALRSKKRHRSIKQEVLKDAVRASLPANEAPPKPSAATREPSTKEKVGELRGSLFKLEMDQSQKTKKQEQRIRRQFKLRHRAENIQRGKLPSERLEPGSLSLSVRSAVDVDSDRLVASMASLAHAGPDPKAFEMRSRVLEAMDEDDESDDDGDEDKEEGEMD